MARIVWTREALRRLWAIRDYIQNFNPGAADRIAARLLAAADSLSDFPDRGRPAPHDCRELPSVRPYVIVYQRHGDMVAIIDIRHTAQLPRED